MVGGQYVVAGAIAHGGLGWIYAARDHNVSDRWVVLKGLLNSGDPDALAAAIAERRFLAQVEHPLIVEIYNFVTHEAPATSSWSTSAAPRSSSAQGADAGGGRTYNRSPSTRRSPSSSRSSRPSSTSTTSPRVLRLQARQPHPGRRCRQVIDLGGVRRLDDLDSAIYGTTGYQAPEVPHVGPSVASDIYTIGRTLTVLAMEFRGYQSTYVGSLPPVDETPCSRDTTRCTDCCSRRAPLIRPTASCPPTSCACSSRGAPRGGGPGARRRLEHSTSSCFRRPHGLRRLPRLAGPPQAASR